MYVFKHLFCVLYIYTYEWEYDYFIGKHVLKSDSGITVQNVWTSEFLKCESIFVPWKIPKNE